MLDLRVFLIVLRVRQLLLLRALGSRKFSGCLRTSARTIGTTCWSMGVTMYLAGTIRGTFGGTTRRADS